MKETDFNTIWNNELAKQVRDNVCRCKRNCWMPHIVAPEVRKKVWVNAFWIIKNKLNFSPRNQLILKMGNIIQNDEMSVLGNIQREK